MRFEIIIEFIPHNSSEKDPETSGKEKILKKVSSAKRPLSEKEFYPFINV
jgi:hypothetical protein